MNRSALLIALTIGFAVLAGVFAGAYFFGGRGGGGGGVPGGERPLPAGMEAAEAAYARGDYEETLAQLLPLAESGVPLAQYRVGLMYDDGRGVTEDADAAIDWLGRALASGQGFTGVTDAETRLGTLYFDKAAEQSEPADQIDWLERSAGLGHAPAQAVLGGYFLQGVAVDRNLPRALELMRAAAEQGEITAASNLGFLYQSDDGGVDQDLEEALRWYRIAAEGGQARAQTIYASLLQAGVGGGENDLAEAAQWYLTASAQGDPIAQARLGSLIAQDVISHPDPAVQAQYVGQAVQGGDQGALTWLEGRAEADDRFALGALAQLYAAGEGVTQDEARAIEYLVEAAEAGHAVSQVELGRRYGAGEGFEQDYVQAHKWVNLAAASGDEGAADARAAYTQLMSPEQIEEAQELARAWTEARRAGAGQEE